MFFKKKSRQQPKVPLQKRIKKAQREVAEFREEEVAKRTRIKAEGARQRAEVERQKKHYLDSIDKQYDASPQKAQHLQVDKGIDNENT